MVKCQFLLTHIKRNNFLNVLKGSFWLHASLSWMFLSVASMSGQILRIQAKDSEWSTMSPLWMQKPRVIPQLSDHLSSVSVYQTSSINVQ